MENNELKRSLFKVIGFGELGEKAINIITKEGLADKEQLGIDMTIIDTRNSIFNVETLLEGVDVLILVADPSELNDLQKTIISNARKKDILALGMTSKSRLYSMKEDEFYLQMINCGIDSLFTFYKSSKSKVTGNEITPYEKNSPEDWIAYSIQTLATMINVPKAIYLELTDLRNSLKDCGMAQIGLGYGSGEQKGTEAAMMAMDPYNNALDMKDATHFIIDVLGDVSLMDASYASDYIRDITTKDSDIIFTAGYDNDAYKDACRVVVLASKFQNSPTKRPYAWLWQ